MTTETMKKIEIYHPKARHIISIFFWIILLLTIIFQFPNFSNKFLSFLLCVLLTVAILFDLKRLIKPAVVIDSFKISFPLNNEFVYWENIDKIEFNNIKNLEIKVKQIDQNRKKWNVPRVFDDYDDNGYLDFSLYRLDLESLKINNEQFYNTILDLSKKSKAEREIQISRNKD